MREYNTSSIISVDFPPFDPYDDNYNADTRIKSLDKLKTNLSCVEDSPVIGIPMSNYHVNTTYTSMQNSYDISIPTKKECIIKTSTDILQLLTAFVKRNNKYYKCTQYDLILYCSVMRLHYFVVHAT